MSQLDRRQALKLVAGIGAAAAVPGLAACGGSSLSEDNGSGGASSGGPVKIGVLAPQSGVYKLLGDDTFNGFKLYLEMHGNKLGGRDVQMVTADEGETGDSGKAGAEKLLKQEKVHAMVGVISSAVMGAIIDTVESAQIPLVGTNASPLALKDAKYIWRTSYANDEPGKALGAYLDKNVQGTVYCIAADYQAGKDEVNGLLATMPRSKLAGDPIWTPFAPTPTKDYAPYLSRIRNSAAKAVFCFYAGSAAVDFVKQYKQFGLTQTLYAPGFLTEGAVIKAQGDAATGIFTSMNYAADLDNPANRSFASEYQKKPEWGLPTTYAMATYDAAAVLDKAIGLAGENLTPQAINEAIAKVGQIESPRGTWQFNQQRTPQQKWYLREVKNDGTMLSNVLVSELTTLG